MAPRTRLRTQLLLISALVVLPYACTSPQQAQCKANPDCGAQQVCLPIGSCSAACTNDAQCGAGQKCSAGGGCVATSGCGADSDCSEAQVCGDQGTCITHCDYAGCGQGETCVAGHCRSDSEPQSDAGTSCGGELFQASRVQANFLIVLDHSGSMKELAGGQPKWTSAVSAVTNVTRQHESAIRFGLQLFSFASNNCNAGRVNVNIGDGTASAIASALPQTADGNGTPIAGALSVAKQAAGLADSTRSNNVLLITDGMENCNGDPVQQVKSLFAAGVKTYVVGFGNGVDATTLSDMAVAGGTALSGTTKYYQADDPTSLDNALAQVAQGAVGCDFKLADTPPDPTKIFVYVNGKLQAHDATRQNGWEYSATQNRLTLYGGTCSLIANDPTAKVSIVYGCPDDSLVEGGTHPGDAGTSEPTDGGPQIN